MSPRLSPRARLIAAWVIIAAAIAVTAVLVLLSESGKVPPWTVVVALLAAIAVFVTLMCWPGGRQQ
jgi:hypothetical protein